MSPSDFDRRVAEILAEFEESHARHEAVSQCVVAQGETLDNHGVRITDLETNYGGVSARVEEILATGGRLDQQDEAIAQIATGLDGERQNREATDERVGRAERRLNRLDGEFPWIFWGGITTVTFVANMLFWRVMLYGANWHPWLGDRGGPEYWQHHDPSRLNFAWWVWAIVTTVAISGIAWIVLSLLGDRDRENNNANADGSAEPAKVGQTDSVNPTTAPIEALEPPPVVDQPTSVFAPGQQPALQ